MADRYTLHRIRLRQWIQHRDTLLANGDYDEHAAACLTVNRLRQELAHLIEGMGRMSKKDKATRRATIECDVVSKYPVFVTVDEATRAALADSSIVVRHRDHWHTAERTIDVNRIYGKRHV